ncbi:hypothetical protein TREES_T100012091 [Tupaia chinensis]|uniref:Uncharacterized protein n=1 Tax=Tupaia chinensis TaxID=246437 RepID=L9K9B1_TUPCH|nr:hypothetical protein TREES_T100012091 [Tupaia chinensis]
MAPSLLSLSCQPSSTPTTDTAHRAPPPHLPALGPPNRLVLPQERSCEGRGPPSSFQLPWESSATSQLLSTLPVRAGLPWGLGCTGLRPLAVTDGQDDFEEPSQLVSCTPEPGPLGSSPASQAHQRSL